MTPKPYIVPARQEVQYPLVRVSALSITQGKARDPVNIAYEISRHRDIDDDTSEDAPNRGGTVSGGVQLGMATLVSDPELVQAIAIVTKFAVLEAVKAGLLEVQS